MNEKQQLGQMGENFATEVLNWKGYEILSRNYRCKFGEVDIIAKKHGELCFIEVKTRQNRVFGDPCEAVTEKKIQAMRKTAMEYLKEQNVFYRGLSFEVMEIGVNHIECGF